MAIFRVTWQYRGSAGSLWNEVYYTVASDAATAASPPSALVNARLALLSPLNTLVAIRSAQFQATRVTAVLTRNYSGTAPTSTGAANEGPETVGSCAVYSLAGSSGGARKIWLRGLSDVDIQHSVANGADDPPAGFISRLNTWVKALVNAGYGLIKVSPQTPGPLTNIKILKVDGSALNGTSILTLASAPGYPFPSRVIIGGSSPKDTPALNGRWSLNAAPVGSEISINYQTPQGIVVIGGNAHVRQEVYSGVSPFDYNLSDFAYYGTRITKNAATRSRGARRAARIRTLV